MNSAAHHLLLATQLINAGSMPPGLPRTKATLDVSLQARQSGDEILEAQADLALVGCYLAAGNARKTLDAFSVSLSRILRRPELYTPSQLRQLGLYYLEVCQVAAHHPDIPLSLVNHLLAGVEAFQEGAAASLATAYYVRHSVRESLGLGFAHRKYLDLAVSTVTSGESRAIRRAIDLAQVEQVARENPRAALAVAYRMLTHELPAVQRARLLRAMLVPLILTESWQMAWEAHLVAYAHDRETGRVGDLVAHLEYLACVGNFDRLQVLLARHLTALRAANDPWELLYYLRTVVGALESLELAGRGGQVLPVSVAAINRWHDIPALLRPTITQARDLLGTALSKLALRFDERNGTPEVSATLTLLPETHMPASVEVAGGDEDYKVLARMLRARALLECDQAFDALIILNALAESNFPAAKALAGHLQMLMALGRVRLSATD